MKQVTTGEKKWIRVPIVLIVFLLLYAGMWWQANPIRLHQTVQVEGVTVRVPFGWVLKTFPSRVAAVAYVNLRHATTPWMPGRTWVMATVSRGNGDGGPFTIETARRNQAGSAAGYEDSAHYSDARTFEVTSGKYPTLCAEGTMPARGSTDSAKVLSCYVVGTPLQVSLMSTGDVDRDLKRVLSSLN